MRQRIGKPSYFLLTFLTLLSLLLFYLAEKSQTPRKAAYYEEKIEAANLAKTAQELVKAELLNRGYVIDVQNDPNVTGLIGPQYSLVTTDRGYIRDKLIATNPNIAAVLIELFHKANLKAGDLVAVMCTGSFPSINISVLAACRVMNLKPVMIASIGASSWGANRPNFTWLDMEKALADKGLWEFRSAAASLGGGMDHGRGLSPDGRLLLEEAIKNSGVRLISSISEEFPSGSLQKNIEKRIAIFDSLAGDEEYKAVINVGGGLASVGSAQNAKLIPPGYIGKLHERKLPAGGALTIMAERRIPVIHLLQIARFAERHNLPTDITEESEIGEGPVYFQERYSIATTLVYTIILLAVLWGAIRIDFRYYIYRNKHLFVRKNR